VFSGSDAFERFMGRWSRPLAQSFVTFAQVGDGDRVLDVGCGTGAVAAAVLSATASARVTGLDASATYVEHARARTSSDRASFQAGDARQLPFADDMFDSTLSLLVINFVPDRDTALREMVRVTRPGGTVAAAVWDYGEGMEMLRVFWDEAVAIDAAADARDERHMPLCRQGELSAAWRQQGLADVRETALAVPLRFSSFEDFWLPFLLGQGPAGAYVASLPESRQGLLRDRLRTRLVAEGDGPFTLHGRAWAVKGAVSS
jgi:SAM-dependent methyltransferase